MEIYDRGKTFDEVCGKRYGRQIILTTADEITDSNIVQELTDALMVHNQNAIEIDYLYNYYKGSQPILYRTKQVRPEINNRVVVNSAYDLVEFKVAQAMGEGIVYARQGTDDINSEKIRLLNSYMASEDKAAVDISLGRWRSICGTAYRFLYMDKTRTEYDETPFGLECLDPRFTGVVYSNDDGKPPMFAFMEKVDSDGSKYYVVYTKKVRYEIKNAEIRAKSINGMNNIPIVEYQNNDFLLSDIELVITLFDAKNKLKSDRLNGVEQFVQSFMKFVNCEIDDEIFKELREAGAIAVKTTNPNAKADVEIMTAELNQEQTQTLVDDIDDAILTVSGMPSREQNTGGDTGQAVYLRNGWDFAEQRTKINEPRLKKSERQFLRIVLSILNIKRDLDLKISEIDIKMPRSQMDNLSVKVNALTLLIKLGIDPQIAIKTVSIWSDSDEVYLRSKDSIAELLVGNGQGTKQIEQPGNGENE